MNPKKLQKTISEHAFALSFRRMLITKFRSRLPKIIMLYSVIKKSQCFCTKLWKDADLQNSRSLSNLPRWGNCKNKNREIAQEGRKMEKQDPCLAASHKVNSSVVFRQHQCNLKLACILTFTYPNRKDCMVI